MYRLSLVALGLALLVACGKPPAPPAAADDPIPLTGRVDVLESMDHKYLHYAVGLSMDAPPQAVWDVLVDAPSYAEWNSTVVDLEGTIALEERIELTARIDPSRTFKLRVSTLEAPSRMVWEDGNNVFRGVRTFTLSPRDGGGTDFTMKEAFSGTMLPMIAKKLPDFGPEFEAFAADLSAEASRR